MTDRDPSSGKFVKGKSGNPGGRPKLEVSVYELIDAAVTVADWQYIISVVAQQAKRGNLKAVELLLDRRFGKATQPISGEDGKAIPIEVFGKALGKVYGGSDSD